VWSNVVGVSLVGGNSGTVIDGNKIGGNQGAGIESSSAGNTALVHDNVVDHNEHGVVVSDGTIEIRGNRIEDNTLGVAVLDKSPRVIIRDNTIRNSADGGIRLVSVKDVVVEGNSITNNRMAAFIVDHANDSQSFQATNRYDSGRKGAEWVYEPLRSAAELADLTPVPSEFFTQPNVEFLLPAEQGGVR
jgi:parallel beta-helix repeat protein